MNGLGVIFDMDGVLIDTFTTHLRAWQETAAGYGVTVDAEAFRPVFGRKGKVIIQTLWPGRFSDDDAADFDQRKQAAFRVLLAKDFPEIDGVGDLIASLHYAGFQLAIGSSGSVENVEMVRRLLSNGRYIDAMVCGSDVKEGKPDPEVFRVSAKRLGLDAGRCAVIEDALAGLEAARRAGAAAVGLVGTETAESLATKAHLVVRSLRELTPDRLAMLIREQGQVHH